MRKGKWRAQDRPPAQAMNNCAAAVSPRNSGAREYGASQDSTLGNSHSVKDPDA
jgi:hypothetical protein